MHTPIQKLQKYVQGLLNSESRPFYLLVDNALRAVSWEGAAAHYGFVDLAPQQALDGELAILATAERNSDRAIQWRFVQLPGGAIAHIHVIALADGWGVAMLDASREHAFNQARQQVAHDMELLQADQARLIRELEQANRLKSLFIGRMSHEFRTPLSSILGYADLMQDGSDRNHLSAIRRNARYLANLVDNLLDQARSESSEITLHPTGCDLQELAMQVEEMFRPLANTRNLSLAWWFDADVPPRIWADATRLQQILINLVGNALKFTQEGGVSIDFAWRDNRLGLTVSDTGPGIAPHELESIFEPYVQGGDKTHGKGAGLGLTITRKLVRQMGGELGVASEGKGASFTFEIPAPEVKGARPGADKSPKKQRLLIADQDPDLLELLRLYLGSTNIEVLTATDRRQFVKAVRDANPAAILLDRQFGGSDSWKLASELRSKGYHRPIVCLSAGDTDDRDPEDKVFDAYWRKPIGRADLLAGVQDLLA